MRTPYPKPAPSPVLSVITPAYNAEAYLAACIESVLAQSMTSLEVIIVDDGSGDRTAGIIAKYAALDRRVHGFRGQNRGMSYARNVAMRHARGRYFALLDPDDLWEPGFAATMVGLLERRPDVAVISPNAWYLGGGALDGRPVRPWPANPHEIRFIDMIEQVDAVFAMSVFRREVYDTIGGFNEARYRSEDYEFWLRAAAADFRFITSPEPAARYRNRADTADQAALLESVMSVLASARGFRRRARADELAAIDRQLERLTAQSLLLRGKQALLRGDFTEARSHFWELYRRGNGVPFAALAVALRLAPLPVLTAYRARLRSREKGARAPLALGGVRPGTEGRTQHLA